MKANRRSILPLGESSRLISGHLRPGAVASSYEPCRKDFRPCLTESNTGNISLSPLVVERPTMIYLLRNISGVRSYGLRHWKYNFFFAMEMVDFEAARNTAKQ